MCNCVRFNNKQKSDYPGATHEMTCIDCGIGKMYFINNEVWKYIQNN